jgi:hypothetical protein
MCKAHFRASQTATLKCEVITEEAPVESVIDRIIPSSLVWSPRSGGLMPLIAHLKDGMVAKKPPGWHRNEERRAHQQPPVAQLLTEFDEFEMDLLYTESLLLTGTSQANFKYLAYGWGREVGFHLDLIMRVCARRRPTVPTVPPLPAETFEYADQQRTPSPDHPDNNDDVYDGGQHLSDHQQDGASAGRNGRPSSTTTQSHEAEGGKHGWGLASHDLDDTDMDPEHHFRTDSIDWMQFSSAQLDHLDGEDQASDVQGQRHPSSTSSARAMARWQIDGYRNESNPHYNRSLTDTSEDVQDEMNDEIGGNIDHRDHGNRSTENEQNAQPWSSKGHRRSAAPSNPTLPEIGELPRGRASSKDWGRNRMESVGSIGQVDDLQLDFSTYFLSMQFDEVTLQNIHNEEK